MANSKAQDNIVQLSMHDDVLLQLSSINSNSNPSDPALPIKIAKLEARMAGRASQLVVQSGRQESLSVSAYPTFGHQVLVSSSTDSEDEVLLAIQSYTVCTFYLCSAKLSRRSFIFLLEHSSARVRSNEALVIEIADSECMRLQ